MRPPRTRLDIPAETWGFIIRKVFAFYRYYISAMIVQLVFRRIIAEHWTVFTVFHEVLVAIPAIFLFDYAGFQQASGFQLGVEWYLSAMILGMFCLYPLLLKKYSWTIKVIFPIIGLWTLGFIYAQIGGISDKAYWFGFANAGLLRGIGEMALGASCYGIVVKLREIRFTKISVQGMRILKTACYLIVLFYTSGNYNSRYQIHMLFLLLFAITITYSFNIIDGTKHRAIYGLCLWLGKISMPLYLIHSVVNSVAINYLGRDISKTVIVLLMVGSIAAAVVLLYGTDWVVSRFTRLKHYFLQPDVSR